MLPVYELESGMAAVATLGAWKAYASTPTTPPTLALELAPVPAQESAVSLPFGVGRGGPVAPLLATTGWARVEPV